MVNLPPSLIIGFVGYWFFVYLLYRRYRNKNKQPKDEPKQSKPYRISRNFFTILKMNRRKKDKRERKDNTKYRQSGDTRTQEEIQDALDEKFNEPDRWKKDYM